MGRSIRAGLRSGALALAIGAPLLWSSAADAVLFPLKFSSSILLGDGPPVNVDNPCHPTFVPPFVVCEAAAIQDSGSSGNSHLEAFVSGTGISSLSATKVGNPVGSWEAVTVETGFFRAVAAVPSLEFEAFFPEISIHADLLPETSARFLIELSYAGGADILAGGVLAMDADSVVTYTPIGLDLEPEVDLDAGTVFIDRLLLSVPLAVSLLPDEEFDFSVRKEVAVVGRAVEGAQVRIQDPFDLSGPGMLYTGLPIEPFARVPEPATTLLLASGVLAGALVRQRRPRARPGRR